MITKVFSREDVELYTTWRHEDGGIVSIIVPEVGEVRMTLAKAEEISGQLAIQAKYGRKAARAIES